MNQAVERLALAQRPTGAFRDAYGRESIFATAFVLSCLNKLPDDENTSLIKKAANLWLLSQKNADWIIGSDLGANFFALSSIFNFDKGAISGDALAKILISLASAEINEGGPYASRFDGSADTDLGVNAAVAGFLALSDVELPELEKLFDQAISSKDFTSRIFSAEYFVIYLLSEFVRGEKAKKLAAVINEKIEKQIPTNETEKWLALVSFANLERSAERAKAMKEKLNINFEDEAGANADCEPNSFSEEMLFAIKILAINILSNSPAAEQKEYIFDVEEQIMMEIILAKAEKRFADLCGEMKNIAMREVKNIIAQNPDKQMSLMSFYMKRALGMNGKKISDDLVAEMGLANIFYWDAFIIYDNFWDVDEEADPKTLPTANLFARDYSAFFHSLLPDRTGFQNFFRDIMDGLDAANTWETIFCRTKVIGNRFTIPTILPDYGNYEMKFRPASGHVLGPVAMLYMFGYNEDSDEVKNLVDYFRNYLIAMQINDDAHDWEEDMARGHLSTAVVMLVQEYKKEFPGMTEIDLIDDKENLRRIFWFKTIKPLCEAAVRHAQKSRRALHAMKTIENFAPLEKYIDLTENAAQKALDEQRKSVEFLEEFKN